MMKLIIAGIRIELIADNSYSPGRLKQFISGFDGDADLKVFMRSCACIGKPEGTLFLNDDIILFSKSYDGRRISFYMPRRRNPAELICRFDVDCSWNMAVAEYVNEDSVVENVVNEFLGNVLFRSRILFHSGIVLHASAVEWQGRGILFSAPKGTGKSTHACLWESFMGARILNDDCPAVRIIDDRPYIFGTPWSGSSCKFINGSAPLSAVVILEQGPVNTIRRLDNHKAVSLLLPRCFLPYHDSKLMDSAISIVEKIITSVPVYFLSCRPERKAMELVHQCVI